VSNLIFDIKEESRLRVFENWVLRRIFGPKKDEVTGGRGKLVTSNYKICILCWCEGDEGIDT
jgi:hypothetical protein